jgi:thiopurine S-methyltransferase
MEQQFWLNKWRDHEIKWHQEKVTPDLIKYADKLELHAGDAILVPLCGKSKDMLWLADRGYHVIGVELSQIACEDFFNELHVKPAISQSAKLKKYQYKNMEIFCGDIFDMTSSQLPEIKAIFDCRALIALPPDMRQKYVNHLTTCTANKAGILLLTIESQNEIAGPPFSIDSKEVNSLYVSDFSIQQLKHEAANKIQQHLVDKGYASMIEGAYLLIPKGKE